MRIAAHAPGKLAVLGEYAVLGGAPALVLAVDRCCTAEIETASAAAGAAGGKRSRLETRFPDARRYAAAPGAPMGVPLVDLVCRTWPVGMPKAIENADCDARGALPRAGASLEAAAGQTECGGRSGAPSLAAFRAVLDSSAFYLGQTKLGLGSSAAALCAFAGAWTAWCGLPRPSLDELVALHRRFQGGAGSGFDVAASLLGGALEFRLDSDSTPRAVSVRMPNSVGFASIFSGRPAATPDFVARFHAWQAEQPVKAEERQRIMEGIAAAGCAAARENDSRSLIRAVGLYAEQLELLGLDIGADIVTREHRAIGEIARGFGLAYKVSGAGGGDLGLSMGEDPEALAAFAQAAAAQGYLAVNLHLASRGLVVEEQTE